jgi:glycosyltransferase involved in cell wall biosynthesis
VVDFSVIIPTRNRPQYLAQAVESVLAQKGVGLQVLIVDDGTAALPAFQDPRVSVLNNKERGPVPARNLGVAHATGEFIAFLDDDDWWLRDDFLFRSLRLLKNESDFSFSDGTLVFEDGSTSIPFAFDANATSLETNNSILISGVCYARRLHDTLGGFDEALPYYWDWDWYLRVARSGVALSRLAEPLVAIRVHGGNMSNAEQEMARRNNLSALEAKHGLAPLVLKNHLSLASE